MSRISWYRSCSLCRRPAGCGTPSPADANVRFRGAARRRQRTSDGQSRSTSPPTPAYPAPPSNLAASRSPDRFVAATTAKSDSTGAYTVNVGVAGVLHTRAGRRGVGRSDSVESRQSRRLSRAQRNLRGQVRNHRRRPDAAPYQRCNGDAIGHERGDGPERMVSDRSRMPVERTHRIQHDIRVRFHIPTIRPDLSSLAAASPAFRGWTSRSRNATFDTPDTPPILFDHLTPSAPRDRVSAAAE